MKLAFILGLVCAALVLAGGFAGTFIGFSLGAGFYAAAAVVGLMSFAAYLNHLG